MHVPYTHDYIDFEPTGSFLSLLFTRHCQSHSGSLTRPVLVWQQSKSIYTGQMVGIF